MRQAHVLVDVLLVAGDQRLFARQDLQYELVVLLLQVLQVGLALVWCSCLVGDAGVGLVLLLLMILLMVLLMYLLMDLLLVLKMDLLLDLLLVLLMDLLLVLLLDLLLVLLLVMLLVILYFFVLKES